MAYSKSTAAQSVATPSLNPKLFIIVAMQFLVKQVGFGALAALLARAASAGSTSTPGPKVVPGGYVVELESAENVSLTDYSLQTA
jgi:hypothetical protein